MAAPWPTYDNHEDLAEKLELYFNHCEEEKNIPNVVGMAVYCGFASKQSLIDYEKKSDEFFHVIKKAKSKCYDVKFQEAIKGKLNPTIFIFDAVNNHDMFNTRSENKNRMTGADDDSPVRVSSESQLVTNKLNEIIGKDGC